MSFTREDALAALRALPEAMQVESLEVEKDEIRLVIRATRETEPQLAALFTKALSPLTQNIRIVATAEKPPDPAARQPAQWNRTPLAHVARVIAVGSGKGGVGKSTVTVELALALAEAGKRVGILDADIYGPSIPRMLGLSGEPEFMDGLMVPHKAHGLTAMSIGFLTGDAPAVLRGPMITKTLHQLLRGTRWGTEAAPLDFLLIDLPPGTGDVQLSLAQACPLDGAVIVTTPQEVAVIDARKALLMFGKVGVPILGIVENMAGFADPASGALLPMLGTGGGRRLAEEAGVKLLGALPFYPLLSERLDRGEPVLERDHPAQAIFAKMLRELA